MSAPARPKPTAPRDTVYVLVIRQGTDSGSKYGYIATAAPQTMRQ